jgi:hypothetical protein
MIGIAAVAGLIGAVCAADLGAAYIAIVGYAIIYLLHAIEVKLNKLLDHYAIVVPDYELARD